MVELARLQSSAKRTRVTPPVKPVSFSFLFTSREFYTPICLLRACVTTILRVNVHFVKIVIVFFFFFCVPLVQTLLCFPL
uniref:Transmembrane protein n=1 Tax=Rhipicephalus zambeziensis TaxID=60191 RepID=A0A224YKS8_9ACAR